MVKRGRLAKEDGRKAKYLLRMSKEEQETLDYIHRKTGKSKAEILRKGLQLALFWAESGQMGRVIVQKCFIND